MTWEMWLGAAVLLAVVSVLGQLAHRGRVSLIPVIAFPATFLVLAFVLTQIVLPAMQRTAMSGVQRAIEQAR